MQNAKPASLSPKGEEQLHHIVDQMLSELNTYLANHAAFHQWLIDHAAPAPAPGNHPPSNNSSNGTPLLPHPRNRPR